MRIPLIISRERPLPGSPTEDSNRTQRARRPEDQGAVSGELYRLAGDWISPAPWLAIYHFEGTEANDVNALAFLQMALDDIKQQIDQTKRITICPAAVTRIQHLCKIGLGHCPYPLLELLIARLASTAPRE
jgi:hypothetical protein